MLNDKVILITGGTGSFGKAFVKTVLERYQPKKVIVYSRDELKQFEMSCEFNHPCMRYFLGDVRDVERLTQAMCDVDYVVHAAALKQVPAAEYNPIECIKTNVHGAENVIKAALNTNVQKVVALSTDKAVTPINLYGATKLASDKLFTAANNIVGTRPTRFVVVRYGNVVGSRGSVLPYFCKLLDEGKKELPITDERMTRFWITLDKGVEQVLNAFHCALGGSILVPKIPSIRITDLARSLDPNAKLKVVGIRPGEKLHETLCPADASSYTYEFLDHYIIAPSIHEGYKADFATNLLGEKGKLVPEKSEYNSATNPHFLSLEELAIMNQRVAIA